MGSRGCTRYSTLCSSETYFLLFSCGIIVLFGVIVTTFPMDGVINNYSRVSKGFNSRFGMGIENSLLIAMILALYASIWPLNQTWKTATWSANVSRVDVSMTYFLFFCLLTFWLTSMWLDSLTRLYDSIASDSLWLKSHDLNMTRPVYYKTPVTFEGQP